MDRDGVNDAGFRPCIYINICEHDCTLWLLTVNIWKLYVHCSWRSDPRSYEHYWTNSWSKAWKIFQARSGFEPMTFAIPLQRSTNWANMPNGSWSMFWVQIKPSKWWLTTVDIWKSYLCTAVEETNIEAILTVMNTTELVVEDRFLIRFFNSFYKFICWLKLQPSVFHRHN